MGSLDLLTRLLRCTVDPAFDKIVCRILLQLDGGSITSLNSVNKEWNQFLKMRTKKSDMAIKMSEKLKTQWMNCNPSEILVDVGEQFNSVACSNDFIVLANENICEVRTVKTGDFVTNLTKGNRGFLDRICKLKSSIQEVFISSSVIGSIEYNKTLNLTGIKDHGTLCVWSKYDFRLLAELDFELLPKTYLGSVEAKHKVKVCNDRIVIVLQKAERGFSEEWHPLGERLNFVTWVASEPNKRLEESVIPVAPVSELFSPADEMQFDHDGYHRLVFSTCLESNVVDMKSGQILFRINMLEIKRNNMVSLTSVFNMKLKSTTLRYPMVQIVYEDTRTYLTYMILYDLEEERTVSSYDWHSKSILTNDHVICNGTDAYETNGQFLQRKENSIFVIQEAKSFFTPGMCTSLRGLVVESEVVSFCANRSILATISNGTSNLQILNFWQNKF